MGASHESALIIRRGEVWQTSLSCSFDSLAAARKSASWARVRRGHGVVLSHYEFHKASAMGFRRKRVLCLLPESARCAQAEQELQPSLVAVYFARSL